MSREAILAACARGEISPAVAVARLLLAGERVEQLARDAPAAFADFVERYRDAIARSATALANGVDHHGPADLDGTRALFDALAGDGPDRAAALYTLGEPDLTDAATAELVDVIDAWAPVAGRRVLDFGCGPGRVARALASQADFVLGLDLSPVMTEAARRFAGTGDVQFICGDLLDGLDETGFDLILAVDSLPYVVRLGPDALERRLDALARLLGPGGDLMVFNWSYRDDPAADSAEAHRFADRTGLTLVRCGERPFALWDGTGYHFRQPA